MKACLNGGRQPGEHPRVPVAPAELARAAESAVTAGAEALHLHPRDSEGALAAFRPGEPPVRILVEVSGGPAATAVARADEILRVLETSGAVPPRLLHGEEQTCWPLVAHAGTLGLPTRIGLEDTTAGPYGEAVTGNAELIGMTLATWRSSA